ncbi:MAG: hypothetical protein NWF07_03990 [Candidatus Bathyarchaeota archaeon]|nr:hypothetical protein [Candidatus Bathyarchaeota archaeon]
MDSHSNIHNENKRKQKASNKWSSEFDREYDKTLSYIINMQNRKLFYLELTFMGIFASIIINLSSSIIYELLPYNQNLDRSMVYLYILLLLFLIGYDYFRTRREKYRPFPSVLYYKFEVDNLPPYLWKGRYEKIRKYLDSCKLKDFKDFSNLVLDQFMFYLQVILYRREFSLINEAIEYDSEDYEPNYPILRREYDFSPLSKTDVQIHFSIIIEPEVIFEIVNDVGDLTSARDFNIYLVFSILNPDHPHADDVLNDIHEKIAPVYPEWLSLSIEKGFANRIKNYHRSDLP